MTVPSPTLADLVALLETAIEFGHVQAYPGLGHAKRDWRDCPQTLCRNVHSAIDGTLRAALAESPARSREEPGLDVRALAKALHKATSGYLEHGEPDPEWCEAIAFAIVVDLSGDRT